jgi:uncharacterized membrane protein YhhN
MAPAAPAPPAAGSSVPARPRLMGVAILSVAFVALHVRGPLYVGLPDDGWVAMLAAAQPDAFQVACKVAPILSLAWQSGQLSAASRQRYGTIVSSGLVLSAVGDAALELHDLRKADGGTDGASVEHLFLGGLAAFLCAQLVYAYAFASRSGGRSVVWGAVVAAYVGGAVAFLKPGLPADLVVPVAVYASAIGAMVYTAVTASAPALPGATQAGALGALLFAASDSVLAANEFGPPGVQAALRPYAKTTVMVTYYAAQAAIASSVVWLAPVPAAATAAAAAPVKPAPAAAVADASAASPPASGKSSGSSSAKKKRA